LYGNRSNWESDIELFDQFLVVVMLSRYVVRNQRLFSTRTFFLPLLKSSGRLAVSSSKKVKSVSVKMYKMSKAVYRDPAVVHHWMEDIGQSVHHGWIWVKTGFRLFFKNIEICKKLCWKAAMGHQLSLRESKLLVTTTSDIFKLVPFSLFIIIPFAELALPIFLRLFPNMLPSTFMEKSFDSASVARRIRAKRELAEFFQNVIDEKNRNELKSVEKSDREDLLEEFKQVMMSNDKKNDDFGGVAPFPSVKEIVKFGKLFEEEFKLENLDLSHLQQICRMLGIEPFGFKSHVIIQLRHYVNSLQAEDRRIMWEGVDELTDKELEEACQARGMPVSGVPVETLRVQLDHWLQLSSCREVPISLLLWSRTCFRVAAPKSVSPTLGEEESPPEELFEETAERQKERADDVSRRLEKLEQEISSEERIEETEKEPIAEDREELLECNAKLKEEVQILNEIIDRQELLFSSQLKFLAKLDSSESNEVLNEFQNEVNEISRLLEKARGVGLTVHDQRFYEKFH
jgi:LETM1 and EF-hand domain-containing protein 1